MKQIWFILLMAGVASAQNKGPGGTVVPAPEALGRIKAPDGFKVSVFAAEPDIVQPIASCIDDRGRLFRFPAMVFTSLQRRICFILRIRITTTSRMGRRKYCWMGGRIKVCTMSSAR